MPGPEPSPAVSGGDPIVNTDDAISTFSGDFTAHLMIKSNREPTPGNPAGAGWNIVPDMLPVSTGFPLELMELGVTMYMLHSNNTEAMAFDSKDLAVDIGMLGITTDDWNSITEQPNIVGIINNGTRMEQLGALAKTHTYLGKDETELRVLTDSAIDKLRRITDAEFETLELFLDFT